MISQELKQRITDIDLTNIDQNSDLNKKLVNLKRLVVSAPSAITEDDLKIIAEAESLVQKAQETAVDDEDQELAEALALSMTNLTINSTENDEELARKLQKEEDQNPERIDAMVLESKKIFKEIKNQVKGEVEAEKLQQQIDHEASFKLAQELQNQENSTPISQHNIMSDEEYARKLQAEDLNWDSSL